MRRTDLSAGVTKMEPLQVGDELTVTLFDDVQVTVALKEQTASLAGRSFLATISGYEGMDNAVVLQTAEGLQIDIQDFLHGRVFTVISTATGTTVREFDPNAGEVTPCAPLYPDLSVATNVLSTAASPVRRMATADQAATCVDILVAYDLGAASYAASNGGITNIAQMAVTRMNTALANNGLSSDFRFRLVGVTTLSVSSTSVSSAINSIGSSSTGWADVRTARDAVGADIATTLIDTGSAYGTTGIGYSLGSGDVASFKESAFNVCAIRSVMTTHTMTHEVGHNMGAGHPTSDLASSSSPGPQRDSYSAGYYFTSSSTYYHTIMAYNTDGINSGRYYTEAPLFSSPNRTWMGTVAGDATHNNEATIRSTYAAASKWRASKVAESYDVLFSPEGDSVFDIDEGLTVTLTPGKAGLPIRYTLDGSTPTLSSPLYSTPLTLTQTTTIRAATVTNGILGPIFTAVYTAQAMIKPGVWTNDVTGVKAAAKLNGKLIVAICRRLKSCSRSQALQPVSDGAEFLNWARENGVYLVDYDDSVYADYTEASSYFWSLLGSGSISLPYIACATAQDPDTCILNGFVYSGYSINGITYDGTADSFIKILMSSMDTPSLSPDAETYETFPLSITLTHTGTTGAIYYTLDGTSPTATTGTLYTGPITIGKSGTTLKAAVIENGQAGLCLIKTFNSMSDRINGIFGTSGITWTMDSTKGWQRSDGGLRTGGYMDENYTSSLTAAVSGKGTLKFKYRTYTLTSYYNKPSCTIDGTAQSLTNGMTNEVSLAVSGDTTVTWSYSVTYPSYDCSSGYTSGGASAWCGIWLYSVTWTPEAEETPITDDRPVAVPYTWIATQFPSASTATYAELMDKDSDGDGYSNWAEYLCGTDPNSADPSGEAAVPLCWIAFENGKPKITHNISIPAAAQSTGWQALTKGSSNLKSWSATNTDGPFFKVSVEK